MNPQGGPRSPPPHLGQFIHLALMCSEVCVPKWNRDKILGCVLLLINYYYSPWTNLVTHPSPGKLWSPEGGAMGNCQGFPFYRSCCQVTNSPGITIFRKILRDEVWRLFFLYIGLQMCIWGKGSALLRTRPTWFSPSPDRFIHCNFAQITETANNKQLIGYHQNLKSLDYILPTRPLRNRCV